MLAPIIPAPMTTVVARSLTSRATLPGFSGLLVSRPTPPAEVWDYLLPDDPHRFSWVWSQWSSYEDFVHSSLGELLQPRDAVFLGTIDCESKHPLVHELCRGSDTLLPERLVDLGEALRG